MTDGKAFAGVAVKTPPKTAETPLSGAKSSGEGESYDDAFGKDYDPYAAPLTDDDVAKEKTKDEAWRSNEVPPMPRGNHPLRQRRQRRTKTDDRRRRSMVRRWNTE